MKTMTTDDCNSLSVVGGPRGDACRW